MLEDLKKSKLSLLESHSVLNNNFLYNNCPPASTWHICDGKQGNYYWWPNVCLGALVVLLVVLLSDSVFHEAVHHSFLGSSD